jgi:adenylate kinase family enzyme
MKIERGSRYSTFIKNSIAEGFVIPADLTIRLILADIKGPKLLLNSFPRSLNQLSVFEQQVV